MNIFNRLVYSASLVAFMPFNFDGLKESPYGFALVDTRISSEDLATFGYIDIQHNRVYHQFGELETIEEIADFFTQVGDNSYPLALFAATRIRQMINEVVQTSQKETAWVLLRAFLPTDQYDMLHWHLDGSYYTSTAPDSPPFKFVVTLIGPTTLFYPLPPELRKKAERHNHNRYYMKTLCLEEKIITPSLGQGAVFIGGPRLAALHSEPRIHENRLFLSIVPCKNEQLDEIKARVFSVYPKDSRDLP